MNIYIYVQILHFKELGDTISCHECSLGVYLVICLDNFVYRTIGYGYIAFQIFGGYRHCRQECSLIVNLGINTLLYCYRYFTSVSNVKALGQLLLEILHFKDVWDTVSFGERICSSGRVV